ncbi:MAG: Sec-independent protein translocase TatC [Halobacteriaceae archaeon]
MDEDAARAFQSGRETAGAFLSTLQSHLQHVFIAFVVGLLGGILAMRLFVWPTLEADLRMEGVRIITQTPFDVILLQVKIGLIIGALVAVPVLLFSAREELGKRGLINNIPVARWKVVGVVVAAIGLFLLGALYAYYLFFPIMFDFLANNAQQAGLAPHYSIVYWTQFILVLGISFGLAAQLPLVMSALAYSGVVPYEVFRDNWKYAVVIIFVFGGVASPPDPFTQLLWGLPLVSLYGISLYITKVIVTMKRGGADVSPRGLARRHWNHALGAAVLGSLAGYAFAVTGGLTAVDDGLRAIGSAYRFGGTEPWAVAAFVGVLAFVFTVLVVVYRAVAVASKAQRSGRPGAIDLRELDEAGVRAAPDEAFADLSEDEALAIANDALEAGDEEKAGAVLDRFDEVEAKAEAEAEGEGEGEAEEGGVVSQTAAGVADAFTDEETTEEDIGGYYYDLRFVLDSVRSSLFRIFAVFLFTMGASFYWLYSGGIGTIRRDFLARLPEGVRTQSPLEIITLHPVEALVFEVKVSVLFGAVVALPMVVYAAFPALKDRGVAGGSRRTVAVWGVATLLGLFGGLALGYAYVAPSIISWLVWDAHLADMVITYRVKSFFWLVILTTAGIGFLADVPISMLLFHRGGIVRYPAMRRRWREFAIGTFAFAAVFTPDSLYTMFVIAVPVVAAYFIGLGVLWLVTLGGRRA